MATQTYLTPKELSDRMDGNIVVKTLANWRSSGRGPKFRRFGNKILYPITEVEVWEKAQEYGTTQDYGKKPQQAAA